MQHNVHHHTPVRARLAASAAAVLTLFVAQPAQAQNTTAQGEWAKGRLIVMQRAGLPAAEMEKALKPFGASAKRLGRSNLHVVQLPGGMSETAVSAVLARNPAFKFAELDRRFSLAATPNDPLFPQAWHLARIGAPSAWDAAQGSGVIIAVLDTGLDASHPDIASQAVAGWNFADNNSNTADSNGHGTAVAGAAAATVNNGTGVASVAGAARLMPLRVTDSNGYAYASTIASALTWAAERGARVANVSISGMPGNSTVQSAAQYMKSLGGLVVVAAGNTGTNLGIGVDNTMIPVSATLSSDALASWSSYGNYVALAAPGDQILTTMAGGGYGQWWGTSLASPVVAGVAALLMSARPDLTAAQVESILYSTALDLGAAGRDIQYGHGRVDAAAAVDAALGATAGDTVAPSAAIVAPVTGTSATGIVAVDVTASDNVGVRSVELRVNGSTVATDVSSPYRFAWDSARYAGSTVRVEAVAVDAAGNRGSSAAISVSIGSSVQADAIAPVVTITSPGSGATVSGTVTVAAKASDNMGTAGIKNSLYINSKLVASSTGGAISYKWNLRKVGSGSHTISVVSQDAAGNRGTASLQVRK